MRYNPAEFTREGGALPILFVARGETKKVTVEVIPNERFTRSSIFLVNRSQTYHDYYSKSSRTAMPGIEFSFEPQEFIVNPGQISKFSIIIHARGDAPDGAYSFQYHITTDLLPNSKRSASFTLVVGKDSPFPLDNPPIEDVGCEYLVCGRYVIVKDEGNFQVGDWLELIEGGIAYIDSHPKNVQGGRCTATPEKPPAAKWSAIRVPLDPARPNENLEIKLTISTCGLIIECLPQVGTRPPQEPGPGGRIVRSPTGQDRLSCNNFPDGNSAGTWIWCEKPEPLESMKKYCSSSSAGNVIRPILPKAAQG